MASSSTPRVYLDADIFVSVLRAEPGHEICLEALQAAERNDIHLIASRFLLVEAGRWRGDAPGGQPSADALVERYLENVNVEWVEVDVVITREARRLSWQYHLYSADAVHLATAVRRSADYFMSNDLRYPHGETVEGVHVGRPSIVWTPTLPI